MICAATATCCGACAHVFHTHVDIFKIHSRKSACVVCTYKNGAKTDTCYVRWHIIRSWSECMCVVYVCRVCVSCMCVVYVNSQTSRGRFNLYAYEYMCM